MPDLSRLFHSKFLTTYNLHLITESRNFICQFICHKKNLSYRSITAAEKGLTLFLNNEKKA